MGKTPPNLLLLRLLGIAMSLFAWAFVAFPKIPISWKGGNRTPLSMQSRVVMAIATTSWCLLIFGLPLWFGGSVFVVCILYTFFLSERDRTAYDAQPGSAKRGQTGEVDGTDVGATPRITPIQFRRGLFLLNALIFLVSVYAVVRDLLRPPVTEEQHIVQVLGWIIMATTGLFAVVLYFTRQEKGL